MGKKRVQVSRGRRQQVRQVRPKLQAPAQDSAAQKRQRERYVTSGGMLQAYAPELVIRIGYYAAGVVAACLVIMALLIAFLPFGWPVKVAAALPWVVPIALLASFIAPAFRLAWQDRKKETRLVQGTLIGASSYSQQLGLGMLMIRTRAGDEQYLVSPDKLARVPGNQVTVMVNLTPGLRHVRSVAVVGQRMVPRPEPPMPDVVRRMRVLPIVTPVAMSAAVIVGADGVALAPVPGDLAHALLTIVVAAVLGAAVYGVSLLLQRRLAAEVQKLVPAGS